MSKSRPADPPLPFPGLWERQIHQGEGGQIGNPAAQSPVHQLVWTDQNTLMNCDRFWIFSRDGSLSTTATVTGAPVLGEQPGVRFALGVVNYDSNYTVVDGDTNETIAVGIANAIDNNSELRAALAEYQVPTHFSCHTDGIGYQPYEAPTTVQTVGNATTFDVPYGWECVGLSSDNSTIIISGSVQDSGPYLNLVRIIPGRQAGRGDVGPVYTMQGNYGPGNDAGPIVQLLSGYLGNLDAQFIVNTLQNGVTANAFHVGAGAWVDGAGFNANDDPGHGNFQAASLIGETGDDYQLKLINPLGVDCAWGIYALANEHLALVNIKDKARGSLTLCADLGQAVLDGGLNIVGDLNAQGNMSVAGNALFGAKVSLINQIIDTGHSSCALSNAPASVSGSPQAWLLIGINGVDHYIPAWRAG